jgi:hypothetical protein
MSVAQNPNIVPLRKLETVHINDFIAVARFVVIDLPKIINT